LTLALKPILYLLRLGITCELAYNTLGDIMEYNAVFEGGGVKGIGLVGAIHELESHGYKLKNVAGSSAGAIVAALIAVGYKANEIKELMKEVNYLKFKQKAWVDYLPLGKMLNLGFNYGIYRADNFEKWLHDLCLKKGKATFGDIKNEHYNNQKEKYQLQVTACNVTTKKLLILPHDIKSFGIDPDSLSIAKAVRMSMSLPIFYEPYIIKDKKGYQHLIVDGGLVSNYPIWLLDDGVTKSNIPTFGFKFKNNKENHYPNEVKNLINFFKCVVGACLDAGETYSDFQYSGDKERTVNIDSVILKEGRLVPIHTTDFDISKEDSDLLLNNGQKAAKKFIKNWDFNKWNNKYRNKTNN